MLAIFDVAAMQVVLTEFENYHNIKVATLNVDASYRMELLYFIYFILLRHHHVLS